MKKVTIKDIGGDVIKDNEVYKLKDNPFGNNLTLSSTFLRANQKTNGHTHSGQLQSTCVAARLKGASTKGSSLEGVIS